MASPPHNNNTSGLDAFLPRVRPEDAGDLEEAAEREWMAHVRRGHEFAVRAPAEPPVYAHPHGRGKPLSDTRLWRVKT